MSNCSIVRDLLPLYDDKTVNPKTAAAIEAHLEKCPSCREYYTHIRHVARAMQDPDTRSNYHYAEVVKKIRRSYFTELAIGTVILSAACIGLYKLATRR
jgi:predicted anti-sigma-YlaC factor YlaD